MIAHSPLQTSGREGDALRPRQHREAQRRQVTPAAAAPGGLVGTGVQPHWHQVSHTHCNSDLTQNLKVKFVIFGDFEEKKRDQVVTF